MTSSDLSPGCDFAQTASSPRVSRADPDASFAFLGSMVYESHVGDRPIAIRWRLATPMPAVLHARYATLRPA